jgi:hypothetical protein
MNFNEAKRYANYLSGLLGTAYSYLNNYGFITTTTETHCRSKADSAAIDEIIEVKKPYDVEFTPNDVIGFVVKVLIEQDALAKAVATAKENSDINIDNAVSSNKRKQGFIYILNNMAGVKSSESDATGKGYKFDVNGEQKPYIYDITKTTLIDFDRNNVKSLVKKYSKECDEVSTKLDEANINVTVEFTPAFDITDAFEDLVVS